MGFNTLPFIFIFLPVFLAVYYLMPERLRNGVLALGSLVFYLLGTWKRPWCLALLLGLMALTWLSGRKLAGSKPLLVGNLLVLGLCLFGFKYAGLLGSGIALPLGLSFYSFQMAAYVIDVYRGRMEPEECPVSYAAEILMFPKLLSGPLMDPADLKEQMYRRTCTLRKLDAGLRDFIIGLSMKVLLANQLSGLWQKVGTIGYESISTPFAWLGLIAFTFQIYFDFYGYSLMAVGLGRLLGFHLPENFHYPYMACSMTEFWRRWHMTLGSWFRDYVYIPLGGSRCSRWKLLRNLLVVWLLTGIWHGAGWNFLLWGGCLFVMIAAEKFLYLKILNRYPWLGHLYMMILIPLSWLPFAVAEIRNIVVYLERLFPFFNAPGAYTWYAGDYLKYGQMYVWPLLAGLIFITPWPRKIYEKYKGSLISAVVLLMLFWFSIYCIHMGQDDPFLYFSF